MIEDINIQYIIDVMNIVGVFAFAISGALTAMEHRFDPFGIFIIAFVAGSGGGTLRDMMLSDKTVFWLHEPIYIYITGAGSLLAILFHKRLSYLRQTLSLFDTIGLAFFTVLGVQIGMQYHLPAISCVIIGVVTGTFGGIVRDILVNDVPIIFKKEVYATVSLLGGTLYYFMNVNQTLMIWSEIVAVVFIIVLRLLVVKYKVSLPNVYKERRKRR